MFYPFNHKNQRHQRAMAVEIENLAFSCPYQQGEGVYMARFLYEQLSDTAYYYDDIFLCEEPMGKRDVNETPKSEAEKQEIKKDVAATGLTIVPNPTNGNAHVIYRLQEGEQAELHLYSLTGQTLIQLKLQGDNGNVPIQVSNLPGGVYIYKVKGTVSSVFNGKLVVTK